MTAGVRSQIDEVLDYSLNTKKRNFLETVELQIGLKNYDPRALAQYFAEYIRARPNNM